MNGKILLVDDQPDIIEVLREVLRKEGFTDVLSAVDGAQALALCREQQPDVVVLDVMLPDMDGVEVCRRLREFSHCPIVFLSSKNDDVDKILGLAAGGDDYVTKPFSPKELIYRIKAQLRRLGYNGVQPSPAARPVLRLGSIELDIEGGTATKNRKALELTAKELGLLRCLMENPNRIISKERLYEQVWGEESAICDNTIMVHIRHLREKLEDAPSQPRMLLTVKGLGYKLSDGGGT